MVYFALTVHWLADFFLQPRWMAEQKSSSCGILLVHSLLYTFPIWLVGIAVFPHSMSLALLFAGINGGSHFAIDAVTSRVSKWLYKRATTPRAGDHYSTGEQYMNLFWTVIGFDQLVHVSVLLYTLSFAGVTL